MPNVVGIARRASLAAVAVDGFAAAVGEMKLDAPAASAAATTGDGDGEPKANGNGDVTDEDGGGGDDDGKGASDSKTADDGAPNGNTSAGGDTQEEE